MPEIETKQNPKVQRHRDICTGLNVLYAQKNHDYGDSFHETFVEEGMAMARIRLSDKLNRFKRLSKDGEKVLVIDESIRDTLLDLANYAIMTVMEMDILKEKVEESAKEIEDKHLDFDNRNSTIFCPKCGGRICYEEDKYGIIRAICKKCGRTQYR